MSKPFKGSLTGIGYENKPAPNEKTTVNKGSVTNSGLGKGGAVLKSTSILTGVSDSRPQIGDNKPGATRSK